MLLLALSWLAFQAPPAESDQNAGKGQTVIVAPDEGEKAPPVTSRIGREQPAVLAGEPLAAMALREWANCIVRTRRSAALGLLATPLNSPAQEEAVRDLTESRFGWRSMCVRTRMMRVENIVLRGAIGEALHRWEARRRRPAGDLTPPPPPEMRDRSAELFRAGHCVVEADRAAVAAVMETRPATKRSHEALEALGATIDGCLPDGTRAYDFHPMMLRGALGEPFYLASRGL